MKIRTAIFGVYVAASAAGFAVLMMFILREVRPRYVESMRHTLGDTAALLAVMLETDLEKQPAANLASVWTGNAAALEKASGALRIYVTDANGLVLLGEQSEGGASTSEVRATASIKSRGAVIGFVGVARPLSSVKEAIWHARMRLATGGIAVAVIMMAAGWWIASKLTHSLERLTVYALAVRDGKEARPPESRASEVAALAKAFEEMRVALEGKAYVEHYTQTLAHELKAPLSAIRGAVELMQEVTMPVEERAQFLTHLRVESIRIQAIIDRMLKLASLEARRGLEETEVITAIGCANEAVQALMPIWQARGLKVRIEGAETARVRGERFLLVQAVMNLVQNAIEFSPEGGQIAVKVTLEAGRVRWCVEDEGPGVPAFALTRVFDRFYSLPRPGSTRKSTGLGLSFVREIAALHGGGITLENREQGGTRAVLCLPAVGATTAV